MKKRIVSVILLLAVMASMNFGLVDMVSADVEDSEWIIGEIIKINPRRSEIVVTDERTGEEYEFSVHSKTLATLSLGDEVSFLYDGGSEMAFSIKKI